MSMSHLELMCDSAYPNTKQSKGVMLLSLSLSLNESVVVSPIISLYLLIHCASNSQWREYSGITCLSPSSCSRIDLIRSVGMPFSFVSPAVNFTTFWK